MNKRKSWKDKYGLRKEMRIKKLILESQDHDRENCECEGCFWWAITTTMVRGGRFFKVIPSWKDFDIEEYMRIMQATMRYKIDKNTSKEKLVKYLLSKGKTRGLTKEQAEKMAENMFEGIHVVMYGDAPSPMGLLRDI